MTEKSAPAPAAAQPWTIYSTGQRWTFLAVLFLVSTSNYVDRQIIGVLIEPIKAEFGASDAQMGLLTGLAFAATYATFGIPVARWADRGNRKFIITGAVGIWSGMTALCGIAQNFSQLFLARVGVGLGEAGAIPPAQSLIADYYPPEGRAKALGIFMMSSVAGYAIALILGAYIADVYGWRMAFIAVGIPGFLLVVMSWGFLHEPRSVMDLKPTDHESESLRETFAALLKKCSLRMLTISMIFYFLMAYGALVFTVPLVVRVYDVSLSEAGALFGVASIIGAVIGNLGGGFLADRLAKKDIAWLARLPAYGLFLAWPVYTAAFLMPNLLLLIVILTVGAIILTGVLPSMFAALHAVCGSQRRAMTVAIVFFFGNMIGLGFGPLLTGALSDMFASQYGAAEGLRIAMLVALLAFLPAAWFMLLCARSLKEELEP